MLVPQASDRKRNVLIIEVPVVERVQESSIRPNVMTDIW